MMTSGFRPGCVAILLAAGMVACGGSDGSPTGPSGGGSPGPVGATITITPGGTAPKSVTITVGQSITVVNNNTRSHDIASDPHLAHTDCPPLNMGRINPGQSRTSAALNTGRTCGYHDHDDPENDVWKGQVIVQ
jgi:plastocyanin